MCLQIARDPVACAANGDIFCRECAVSNLLAQRKEIKRLEKEDERRRKEEEEGAKERGEEERLRAVYEFERTMMGLESKKGSDGAETRDHEPHVAGKGVKRKFELDEEEMLRTAKEERARARRALDEEEVGKRFKLGLHMIRNASNSTRSPQSRPSRLFGFRLSLLVLPKPPQLLSSSIRFALAPHQHPHTLYPSRL